MRTRDWQARVHLVAVLSLVAGCSDSSSADPLSSGSTASSSTPAGGSSAGSSADDARANTTAGRGSPAGSGAIAGNPGGGAPQSAAGASVAGTTGDSMTAGGSGAGGSSGQSGAGGRAGKSGAAAGAGGSVVGAAGSGAAGSTGAEVTCPTPGVKAGDTTRMIQIGTTMRSYILHVPTQYQGSKPAPLVVDFHPLGGSGMQERQSSPYPAQTDPEGVVMAFPSGLAGPSGGAWNVGPCCVASVDDVAFARALVADVEKTACIDPKRVYAVGFSMGGGMTHYVACHAADLFAAVAPAAFDLLQENVGDCTPPRPITVVSFRGSADPIVPYAGGPSAVVSGMPITFLGAMGTFQTWAKIDGCPGAASAADSNNCQAYSGCNAGVDVVLCTKEGGSHEPGNATIAWPILKRHTLP